MILLHNGSAKFNRAVNSSKCPQCHETKEKGKAFCNFCLEKLPTDLVHDLKETHEYTQVAAFADATLFLMNDWR